MAYVQAPIPQNEANLAGPQGQTTPNPLSQLPPQGTQPTGGSAGQGGSAGGTNAPGVGTSTQFGSNASKLSDYLSANAPQIQSEGNQIAGNLTSQFGQVQGDVNTAAGAFGNQVNAGYTPQNTDLVNQAAANPTQFVQNPQNVTDFQAQMNDAYTGPQNFESTSPYSQVQGEVNQAVQGAGLLNSPAGLSSYLQSNIPGQYTPGMSLLDTSLLQANPQASQAVTQAAAPFQGLPAYLTGMTSAADALVAPAQQQATQAKTQAQQALTGATAPLVSSLNTELADATTGETNYNQQLSDIGAKISAGNYGQLTPAEQSLIGFNPNILPLEQQYPSIFPTQAAANPIDFSSFYTPGKMADLPTPAGVVTPDQQAEYQALAQLSGTPPAGLNFSMPTTLSPYSLPNTVPQYNNEQAGQAMNANYQPMYQALQPPSGPTFGTGTPIPQNITDFMNSLSAFLGAPQPSPQPVGQPTGGQPVLGPPGKSSGGGRSS